MNNYDLDALLARVVSPTQVITANELFHLLALNDGDDLRRLYQAAYQVKLNHIGRKVHLRGLIEISNICAKDCHYCGIRKSNHEVERFRIGKDDIIRMGKWAFEQHYGSVVLQSGEVSTPEFVDYAEDLIRELSAMSNGKLSITLCLGEQTEETYRRWHEAGAQRYLLRIETSDRELYGRLHPPDHDFNRRLDCLKTLQQLDYQTGTGVMIGLPGQTVEHLVGDLLFFRDHDFDMIGMGPYIPHHQTPLAALAQDFNPEKQFNLGLKMVAVARLMLKDVNIVATTALQALDPKGRERGILAGANVLMPNITDVRYRNSYQLYDNKPCLDENSMQCRNCLERRVISTGETIAWDDPGDSPHYHFRHSNRIRNH